MSLTQTHQEISGHANRYAAAQYVGGGGYAPRSGLNYRQYYVGQILSGSRFHVLKPDRMCSVSEFASFVMVTQPWSRLSEVERSLLVMTYSQTALRLATLATKWPAEQVDEAAFCLVQAGYLRWAEPDVVELTLVGEAEVRHQISNAGAGESVIYRKGGIRIWHHSLQDHEVEVGRESTLSVTEDGMLIRIFTLQGSGAVVRVDHHPSHHIYTNSLDRERGFVQSYIDLGRSHINPPPNETEEDHD